MPSLHNVDQYENESPLASKLKGIKAIVECGMNVDQYEDEAYDPLASMFKGIKALVECGMNVDQYEDEAYDPLASKFKGIKALVECGMNVDQYEDEAYDPLASEFKGIKALVERGMNIVPTKYLMPHEDAIGIADIPIVSMSSPTIMHDLHYVVLAFYLMLIILFQLKLSIHALRLSFAGSMFLLFLPIPIILYSEYTSSFSEVLAVIEEIWKNEEKELLISCEENEPKYGDHYTIPQALSSMDLWLIVIATTCGVGAALTVINNLGQIGLSLGYTATQTNTFVALLSIWDYLGGVATGALSDILVKKYGVPRPFFFALSLGIIAAGNLVLGLNFMPQTLLIGSVLIGLSLGGQWAVLFTIIADNGNICNPNGILVRH